MHCQRLALPRRRGRVLLGRRAPRGHGHRTRGEGQGPAGHGGERRGRRTGFPCCFFKRFPVRPCASSEVYFDTRSPSLPGAPPRSPRVCCPERRGGEWPAGSAGASCSRCQSARVTACPCLLVLTLLGSRASSCRRISVVASRRGRGPGTRSGPSPSRFIYNWHPDTWDGTRTRATPSSDPAPWPDAAGLSLSAPRPPVTVPHTPSPVREGAALGAAPAGAWLSREPRLRKMRMIHRSID